MRHPADSARSQPRTSSRMPRTKIVRSNPRPKRAIGQIDSLPRCRCRPDPPTHRLGKSQPLCLASACSTVSSACSRRVMMKLQVPLRMPDRPSIHRRDGPCRMIGIAAPLRPTVKRCPGSLRQDTELRQLRCQQRLVGGDHRLPAASDARRIGSRSLPPSLDRDVHFRIADQFERLRDRDAVGPLRCASPKSRTAIFETRNRTP